MLEYLNIISNTKKSTGCFCDIVMRLNEKDDKRMIIRLSSDDLSTKLIHIYYI